MTESGNCRTIAEILSEAESKLRNFSETPGLDAEILLANENAIDSAQVNIKKITPATMIRRSIPIIMIFLLSIDNTFIIFNDY